MSHQPPILPSRQSQRAPEGIQQATLPPALPPRTAKPLGSLNARKPEQVAEPAKDDDDTAQPAAAADAADDPPPVQAPRFIAPAPSSSTNNANPLQKFIQPLLLLLALNPSDTPDEAALRKQLEEEQISRYMGSFSRHVQYLRMDGGTGAAGGGVPVHVQDAAGQPMLEKPQKEKFRLSALPEDGPRITDDDVSSVPSELQEEKESGGGGGGDIDWFGYYAALAVYYLHLHIPSLRPVTTSLPPPTPAQTQSESAPPRNREPFTISRLRSSVERLYVDARSPWEALLMRVGEVVMWRDVGASLKWLSVSPVGKRPTNPSGGLQDAVAKVNFALFVAVVSGQKVYVLLTLTNTFTPFLLSIPLYHLIRERLFPPSVAQLREKEREATERLREGHELASDIVQHPPSVSSTYLPTMTLPGGLGGEFATEAAMRGFGLARDSVASYAFGDGNGGGSGGLEHMGDEGGGAVNEDILRPHVKKFVSGVMKQGQAPAPRATGTASITALDPGQGKSTEEETDASSAAPLAGKRGKKEKKVKTATATATEKSKTGKLRDKWEQFKVVHGTGLIVVLDDLADIHERVESLFAWRRPESSVKFAMILLLAILGTHFMPAFWMLKLFQVAIGVVLFIVIPVAARMERYEPISASMTSAPTMAEHVINVMRDRAARGEPLPEYRPPVKAPSRKETALSTSGSITTSAYASTTSLPLTTTEIQEQVVRVDNESDTESISAATATGNAKRKVDWGAMRDQAVAHAHTGTQWWQTGKELWKGEKKVQFSWKGSSEDWENIENSALAARQVSLGAKGPGIHLSVHSTGEQSPYIKEGVSYLARHAGYTGQLYLSSEGLMFVPMIGSAAETEKTSQSASATAAAEEVTHEPEQEEKKGPERQRPEVQVPMSKIVGMRKSNKTAMGVVVSAGLQIDVADGSSIVFSFVANRDVVFNRLLALSKGTFRRI